MNILISVAVVLLGTTIVQGGLDPSKFGPKLQELMISLHNTCVARTNVDETLIPRMRDGEFDDSDKLKSYVTCIFLESTVIDDKGVWNFDLTANLLPEEHRSTILSFLEDCVAKTNSKIR